MIGADHERGEAATIPDKIAVHINTSKEGNYAKE